MQRSIIRKWLNTLFKENSEFEAFCLDYFPNVKFQFGDNMDRTTKTNILLEYASPEMVAYYIRVDRRLPIPTNFETDLPDWIQHTDAPTEGRRCTVVHPLAKAISLFGRKDEQDKLLTAVCDQERKIIEVTGIGGIGKTVFLEHFLARYQENMSPQDGLFVWNFHTDRNTERLLDQLRYHVHQESSGRYEGTISVYSLCRELIQANQQGKLLLVFDGIDAIQDGLGNIIDKTIKHLLDAVKLGIGNVRLIYASRIPILTDDVRDSQLFRIHLGALDQVSSILLLRSVGACGDNQDLQQVSLSVGFHPLALRIIGSMLSRFRIGEISMISMVPNLTKMTSIVASSQLKSILDSYKLLLPPSLCCLLEFLSVFSCGSSVWLIDSIIRHIPDPRDLGSVAELDAIAVRDGLLTLTKLGLVENVFNEAESQFNELIYRVFIKENDYSEKTKHWHKPDLIQIFRIHPALQRYFYDGIDSSQKARYHSAIVNILHQKESRTTRPITHAEMVCLEHIIYHSIQAGEVGYAIRLFTNFEMALGVQPRINIQERTFLRQLVSERLTKYYSDGLFHNQLQTHISLEAQQVIAHKIGRLHYLNEDINKAAKYLLLVSHEDVSRELAHCCLILGKAQAARGYAEKYLSNLTADKRLAYAMIGYACGLGGQCSEALENFQFAEANQSYRSELGSISGGYYAIFLNMLGKIKRSIEIAQINLSIFCDNAIECSRFNVILADVFCKVGETDRAAQFLEKGINFAYECSWIESICQAYLVEGKILLNQGQEGKANERIRESLRIACEYGFTVIGVDCYIQLARLAEISSAYEAMLSAAQNALQLSQEGYVWGTGEALTYIGKFYLYSGSRDEASKHLGLAIEIKERILDPSLAETRSILQSS